MMTSTKPAWFAQLAPSKLRMLAHSNLSAQDAAQSYDFLAKCLSLTFDFIVLKSTVYTSTKYADMPQIVTFADKQVKKHSLVSVLCSLCVEYMTVRAWRRLETGPVLHNTVYKHVNTASRWACTLEFVL